MNIKEKTKMYYEIIIKNIKRKRKELNISKEELSIKINANKNYMNSVEKYKINPSLKYLFRICDELNINFYELLKEEK